MMTMKIKNLIMAAWAVTMLSSCVTPKTVAYFPELTDGQTLALAEAKDIVLKPADHRLFRRAVDQPEP